ncbi:MAG: hypothetical protein U0931_05015 [Vulcanimicrobiota bacterium]
MATEFGPTNMPRLWQAVEALALEPDPAQGVWDAWTALSPYVEKQLPTADMKKALADWHKAVKGLGHFNPTSENYKKPSRAAEKKFREATVKLYSMAVDYLDQD